MADADTFSRLTEPQRATLRLYHQHLQIKEIANHLGIAESTVNQRLTQCRKVVGAPSSRAAAKWFALYEQQSDICSKSAYQVSTMAIPSVPSPHEGLAPMGTDNDDNRVEDMGDSVSPASLAGEERPQAFPWPFATRKGADNHLLGWTRIALVVPVAACLLVMFLIVVLLGIGIQEALTGLQHLFVRQR